MNYRPPRKSLLGAQVSQRVAVVLAAWLPDSQVFQRTASMPEDLRAEVLDTMDAIKAAATMHKQAFAEASVVGNRTVEVSTVQADSMVKEVPPYNSAGFRGDFLRSSEVAGLLGISSRRVLQLLDSGDLTGERPGAEWLITRTSVDNLLAIRKAA